jgi:hypothetical protein
MLIRITLILEANNRKDLRFYLNRLVSLNRYYMRTRVVPPLYKSGTVYAREATAARHSEQWQTCVQVAKSKVGDCEDLAAYRVAELCEHGEDAKIRLTLKGRTWHVTVRRADGSIEDPSKRLGMRAPIRRYA